VVGPPPVGSYVAVGQDPHRDTATGHQDLAYRNIGQAAPACVSDRNTRRPSEQATSADPQRAAIAHVSDRNTRRPSEQATSADPQRAATAHVSDRNTRRPSEQATSANPQTVATKDASRPAQYAMQSRMSRLCMNFFSIPMGQYSKLSLFILHNSEIVSQSEIDSLIAQAREEQLLGHETNAQTFVHHALLLRRCKGLDTKEIGLLFRRLDDRKSETLRDFLSDVKRIHSHLKTSARPSPHILQSSDTRSQSQGSPFEYQAGTQTSRHGVDRPVQGRSSAISTQSEDLGARLAQDQSFTPDILPQVRRVQTNDGNQVQVDEFIRPASTRQEWIRSGPGDDSDEMSHRMASLSMAGAAPRDARIQDTRSVGSEGPNRHVEDANVAQKAPTLDRHRSASVSYGDPMPNLHEGEIGAGREFKGTERESEPLDPRTYLSHPCAQRV
jgi:hypothetical protein